MSNLALDPAGIFNALVSHAMGLGLFDRVNAHETVNPPGLGVTVDFWFMHLKPMPAQSGLASTSALLLVNARIYNLLQAQPTDGLDPNILTAAATLMGQYQGDFDLGGTVESVDLLGRSGSQLEATGGYMKVDDSQYRIVTVTIPMVINDVWSQTA